MTQQVSEQGPDPVQKIRKLEILVAGLELAASNIRRDLESLKAQVIAEEPKEQKRHLWALPMVFAGAAWQVMRKHPMSTAAGTLAAGTLVAGAIYVLPPEQEPKGPPDARPPCCGEPSPPEGVGPQAPGEDAREEPRSGQEEDESGVGEPVADRPAKEDPDPEEPPPSDPEPPEEPGNPMPDTRDLVSAKVCIPRVRCVSLVISSPL